MNCINLICQKLIFWTQWSCSLYPTKVGENCTKYLTIKGRVRSYEKWYKGFKSMNFLKLFTYFIFVPLCLLFSKNSFSEMLEVKIWTKTYHHTFLPLNKSFTTSLETKDGLLCFINYNYKVSFSLNCQRKNKNVVYYEEHSPRINATIKTDRVLIKLGKNASAKS